MAQGKMSDPAKEAERVRKISEARQRRKAELGYINAPETRAKIGEAGRGREVSAETRAKRSAAQKGKARPASATAPMLAAAHAAPRKRGADSPNWKGDKVGYIGLHAWVRKVKGTPQRCEHCGTQEPRRYQWANVSGEYRREESDWVRLCVPCHRKHDKVPPWNKGKQTGHVPSTAFPKGHVPWNKRRET